MSSKPSDIFFKVVMDLKDFLPDIVLIGGWVPYVYQNFVWQDVVVPPHYTTDVDFGVGGTERSLSQTTVYKRISELGYPQKHIKIGQMLPVLPLIRTGDDMNPVPLEFICDEKTDIGGVQNVLGKEIKVNQLSHISTLLSDVNDVAIKNKGESFKIKIPSEAQYVFHKLITFQLRRNPAKRAKDLYYAYYMLRFSPNKEKIILSFDGYKKGSDWDLVKNGLDRYFKSETSEGVILVEREFGQDSIIMDMRKHIWEIFNEII